MQQLVEAEAFTHLFIAKMTKKKKKKKKKTCFSSLPSVCVINLLQYLDMLSLAKASSSSKTLHVDGTLAARCMWKHLVAANLSSPFVTLPASAGQSADDDALCAVCGKDAPLKCSMCKAVCYCSRACQKADWQKFKNNDHKRACKQLQIKGGRAGQRSFAIAAHDLFMRERHEVLLMGGVLSYEGTNKSYEVTKMIIDQKGQDGSTMSIRFEASTPMLEGRCMHASIYHQGEVISVSPGTTERLDTLSETRTMLHEDSPDFLLVRAIVVFRNKVLLIGCKRQINGRRAHSDVVYELVEHAGLEAAKAKWQRQKARLVIPRCSSAAIAFEGKIFVCGGYLIDDEFGDRSHNVEVYNPAVGAWRIDDEEMVAARACFYLFIYEDEIYAVGGDNYAATIEKRNKDEMHLYS